MADFENSQQFDFTVDLDNLYREMGVSDLKVATIRQMIPIHADGSDDPSRSPIFVGHSQVMTPEGPLPLKARLHANNLAEAFDVFPDAIQDALSEVVERLQELQRKKQEQDRDDSRIIVPGG
jgi:hypothetical protein